MWVYSLYVTKTVTYKHVSICVIVYFSVRPSAYLSVRLSVFVIVCFSICLSVSLHVLLFVSLSICPSLSYFISLGCFFPTSITCQQPQRLLLLGGWRKQQTKIEVAVIASFHVPPYFFYVQKYDFYTITQQILIFTCNGNGIRITRTKNEFEVMNKKKKGVKHHSPQIKQNRGS